MHSPLAASNVFLRKGTLPNYFLKILTSIDAEGGRGSGP